MALDNKWIESALRSTGNFETNGDPFAQVAGDFDGQGISAGVLQWNIGQATLQPLVKAAGKAAVTAAMQVYGAKFWLAVTKPVPEALTLVRQWQSAGVIKPDIKKELNRFCGGSEMRAAQLNAAKSVADSAYTGAKKWANDRGVAEPTKKEFCWFFDLVTQNGGLKGLTLADVRQFIRQYGTWRTDDAICDWMAARPPIAGGLSR